MSERRTEPLLRELARDLEPVGPIPALRVAGGAALAVWLAAVLLHWALGFPGPLLDARVWGSPVFLAVLAGLGLLAAGGLLAALAGAVPGREREVRGGRALASAGVFLALGVGVWAAAAEGGGSEGVLLESSLACVGRAAALGFAPALVAAAFVARALPRRPLLAGGVAVAGGGGLGAAAVHVSCDVAAALHLLLGHALAPLVVAGALALPLAGIVRLLARRG